MNDASRLPGFYKASLDERAAVIQHKASLTSEDISVLTGVNGLTLEQGDKLIENVVGLYTLPLGIAANFIVNGNEVLIPMVVEEASIVAGASFMAKLVRDGGGFTSSVDQPEMIGQIQLLDVPDIDAAVEEIQQERNSLLEIAKSADNQIVRLGGGPRDIETRMLKTAVGDMLIVHLIFDALDAMGANMVNTACEALARPLESLTGGRAGLRILSNLADRRLARSECTIPVQSLAFDHYSGDEVRDGIIEAWAFAEADPYRAATHNKGIMNGIDAVVIATGNDWRAIEAGAHAYAARSGRYTSLTTWKKTDAGDLHGEIELPIAMGIVGGATRSHPTAKVALKILSVKTAAELACIVASVGLAQNLAALRALATEGIQRGHMTLHARSLAIAAGAAKGEIDLIAEYMVANKQISLANAAKALQNLRSER